MFNLFSNLFSKNQKPENHTPYVFRTRRDNPAEEEMERQRVLQELREKRKKEEELYNRITKNDENLNRALRMMVNRIDIATHYSLLSKIGTLESRLEELFPESND